TDYVGLSLVALRAKIDQLEELMPMLASGGHLYAWSYFEKVSQLAARGPDESRSETEMGDPCPAVAGEIKLETVLDTLLWAVNKFGGLSNALKQVSEFNANMDKRRADLDEKLQKQYDAGSGKQSIASVKESIIVLGKLVTDMSEVSRQATSLESLNANAKETN
ncbi:unnamed protein product, partial [Durusdinium trenchii]